ncbi:hypothetical protein E1B28_011305 [Marasmius oreades]|uniref:Multiple myeloma tumor-associated protein 2-like N-terminal domain-containing protein n=1 Tax=Marasmius oreades TaxID=181124 RepID=A0A9P7UPU3_9AGAR|nr:uncharacterized protein E1B28_011305 [Marasmius oreades]KAG7089643.1 hypothetical protein E1B28_011305 [Marasmius oreades]
MFEPIRGGTRGGQAEFKWTDVSADKDRENYLGHSINAPTGRWQKGKDVHWYNRDKHGEDDHAEEIRKIKEAEAEALAVALGFQPEPKSDKPLDATSSTSKPKDEEALQQRIPEKEEKRRRKAERKEEKRARKEERRREKIERHESYKRYSPRYDEHERRSRSRSRSPRRRSRSRERNLRERDYLSRRRSGNDSVTPPLRPTRDYDDRERERESDRRRWDSHTRREQPRGGGRDSYR